DFAKIYDQENKKGKEVIFALHFHRDEQGNHYSDRLKPRDIFVQDAVNREDIAYARSGARSQYAPSPKLQEAFLENPSDNRAAHSYIAAVTAQEKVIGVFDNKMRGSVNAGNRYYDDDLIVYRLAEMILFKAEAFAALGKIEEAIIELNIIRERAEIGPYLGANTKQAVEEAILQERFREFYLELKRWPDLIRYHHAGTIDVYQQVPNLVGKSVPLFSPIPQTEIDRNTLLEQTNGY
ncbi:MAG TPA: RagB/SusD family nutrient uptake outer membrane protein, partial [Candidatus Sphingobacterium stercorigallinarum]|nr:RagB/SusD family nutrient uptake outer membrane protein [Candidatus Sphingobacterium stercorigallinarum]